jgi:hypothetical protein
MLQDIMLVVGVRYVFQLLTIGRSGLKLGLPPEVLVEWRARRKKQYLWGIAAGWGSLVAGILTSVGMTPSYPTTTDVARAQLSTTRSPRKRAFANHLTAIGAGLLLLIPLALAGSVSTAFLAWIPL